MCTAVTQSLRHAAQPELAAALSPKRSSGDRLGTADEATRYEGRTAVEKSEGHAPATHPRHHQRGKVPGLSPREPDRGQRERP